MGIKPNSNIRTNEETKAPPHQLPNKGRARAERILIAIFIFLAINIVGFGYISYQNYSKHFRQDIEKMLATISDLKAGEIEQYINERLLDGSMFFRRRTFYDAVLRFFENPEDVKNTEYLNNWVERYTKHSQYSGLSILDTQGVVRLSIPDKENKFYCPSILKNLPEILNKHSVQFTDFCRSDYDNSMCISILVPILDEDESSQPIALLVMRIDPKDYLYPFIEKWPVPSKTAETMLVSLDGGDALVLNELRFRKNTALSMRFAISTNKDLIAVKAVLGKTGIVKGRDYRGIQAIAYVRAIADMPWFLISRIDMSEAYEPMRRQLADIIWFIIASIIATGAVIWIILRRRNLLFYRSQYLSAEALRASEERYRRLFEAAKDGILLVDADTGMILQANMYLVDLLGYSKSDLLQRYLWDIGALKDVVASKDNFIKLQTTGYIRYEDLPLKTKDGKEVNVEFVSNVYTAGKTKIIQCNIRDITERKRLTEELAHAKETQYRTLIENLPQKVFLKDKNSVYISCNTNYASDLKIKPEEIEGKTDYDFFPTYLAEKYREDDKRVMDSNRTENIEEEYMVIKDFLRGAQKAVVNTVKIPVRDKQGNITGLFGLFWDITERRKTEEEQRRLAALIETTPDFVGFADANYKHILYINKAGRKMCGIGDNDDVTKLKIEDIHPGWANKRLIEEALPAAASDGIWVGECAFLNIKDGNETPVLMALSSHKAPNGELETFATISRDITERKRAENSVRDLNRQIEFILGATKTGIDIIDSEFNLIYVDSEWQKVYGGPPDGRKCYEYFMDRDEVCSNCGVMKALETKKTVITEEVLKKEKGRIIQVTSMPFQDKDGNWLVAEVNVDITERKRLEEELRKADALKAASDIKSKFTSMVSHELRSPLSVIKESINLVTEGLVGSVTLEQKDILSTAKSNIDRLGRLINNVLDFQKIEAKRLDLDFKEYDINEVVLTTGKEINFLAQEKGLSFTINIDEDIPRIKFDKDRIIQVLTNLLSNAVKFTEKGGIVVNTRREDNMAHITVKDTGVGIRVDDMPKLFQTFEQLGGGLGKKKGGTGLGLAISKEIIQEHNGKIWVESQFGKGSAFHFTLPIKERRG